MTKHADAIVVGGGVMGCAAAFYLTELGVPDVLLLERDTLASGSTGRSMAILRMHYSNEVTTRMAVESRDIMADFENITGVPSGFVETGYLLLAGPGQEDALRRNASLSRFLGVEVEVWSPEDARGFRGFEWNFDRVSAIAHEPHSGYADTSAVTNGFASAARRRGARIELGTVVRGIAVERSRVRGVETNRGFVASDAVVVSAGPWAQELLVGVGVTAPLSYVRHQVVKLDCPRKIASQLPTVGDVPNYGMSFRHDSGDVVLIGIREDPVERDGYQQGVDTAVVEQAMQALTRRVPALEAAAWDGGWSGLFTVTPDWHPIIDRVPGIDGLVCGVGFSGHGFKLSPAVGRALAEFTVHGRATSIDMSPLRFSRFAEGALLQSAYGATVFA